MGLFTFYPFSIQTALTPPSSPSILLYSDFNAQWIEENDIVKSPEETMRNYGAGVTGLTYLGCNYARR